MKIMPYLLIAIIGLYIGYALSGVRIKNKDTESKIDSLINELKFQVAEIQDRLKLPDLSQQEIKELKDKEGRILKLVVGSL